MKKIDDYKMFDPIHMEKGLPADTSENYIFLLRPYVNLPEDVINFQPTFTSLSYKDKEYRVLYTGVTKSLYNRILKTHFGNNAGRSTFRKSLGCLWGYQFIYRDRNRDKTKYKAPDEQAITQWMKENLLVLYVQNSNYKTEETEMIKDFNPPLNLDENTNLINKEYRSMISQLRNRPVEE